MMNLMELENICDNIVNSVFPDVTFLKKKCIEYGMIPSKYRGEIWSLFLSGGVLRDDETFDHINEQVNYREIHDSSGKILKIWHYHGSKFEPSPHFIDDLSDILALFCKRMNIQFNPSSDIYLCNVLLPLLSTTQPIARSLASSCFYALCTSFLPLSPFQTSSQLDSSSTPSSATSTHLLTYETIKHNLITEKLSSWLRILVCYHFPSLSIHLDSIFPNWEKISLNSKNNVFGENISITPPVNSSPEIQSGGLLPPAWIGGLFAGSFLTSASILRLWDWCILWDQKLASIYLTASLLGLHEEHILEMTTPVELIAWVQSICEGGMKSFVQCKSFQAASSYRPHDITLSTEQITPSRLFGDEFDDDDDFHLSSTLSNPRGVIGQMRLNEHEHENEEDEDEDTSLLPLNEGTQTHTEQQHDQRQHTHHHHHSLSRDNTISVSIGWDGETDEHSDSDDEAALAFYNQCAAVSLSSPLPQSPLQTTTPTATAIATGTATGAGIGIGNEEHQNHNDHPFETPEFRQSEETFTQDITIERLEELFVAGWIACTSRLIRNTPVTFQTALLQVTEWATHRAREEYISRQHRGESHLPPPSSSTTSSSSLSTSFPSTTISTSSLSSSSSKIRDQIHTKTSSIPKSVPVEYQKTDELDRSSHNWSPQTPEITRARAQSSPGDEDSDDWKKSPDELNEETDLIDDLNPRTSESKSKFQLIVETSNIAAEYGKSIWERVSQKAKLSDDGGGKGPTLTGQLETTPLSQTDSQTIPERSKLSFNWPLHDHSKRMCLFTSAEEVLPCVCSTRRRSNVTSESLFLEAFQKNSTPVEGDGLLGMPPFTFPSPLAESSELNERPFFFAVDCWPDINQDIVQDAFEEEDKLTAVKRICRIPKAFQMSYTAIVDANAMTEMLNVLEPLAHVVHIVLIGMGTEIIQQHHSRRELSNQQKSLRFGLGLRGKEEQQMDLENFVELEDAQIGAMAMALMKHGFPHVSILEGGYSSVLKYLRNCDGRSVDSINSTQNYRMKRGGEDSSLGMHVLVDVDHEAVNSLFQPPKSSTTENHSNSGTSSHSHGHSGSGGGSGGGGNSSGNNGGGKSVTSSSGGVVDLLSNTYGMFRRRQSAHSDSK